MKNKPIIGILGCEITDKITLSLLESIPGNIAHSNTFSFPIKYARIKGTHYKNIVESLSIKTLNEMIKANTRWEDKGTVKGSNGMVELMLTHNPIYIFRE